MSRKWHWYDPFATSATCRPRFACLAAMRARMAVSNCGPFCAGSRREGQKKSGASASALSPTFFWNASLFARFPAACVSAV